MIVAFQGTRGAYSEGAAREFFGDGASTLPSASFADAAGAVESGRAERAVLPVENSIEGSVGEVHDLLAVSRLSAVGEIYHHIEHCLIGNGRLDGVRTVYSHPQALGQCRKFIESRGLKTIPTYDTAGSVQIVRDLGGAEAACIASRQAARTHGLPVISEGIADRQDNRTRFLVLADGAARPPDADKTSVIFSLRHERGALFRAVSCFNGSGINLTRIESRPTRSAAWEYNFYVDFEGSEGQGNVDEALEGVRKEAVFFKSLGSYRSAKTRGACGR